MPPPGDHEIPASLEQLREVAASVVALLSLCIEAELFDEKDYDERKAQADSELDQQFAAWVEGLGRRNGNGKAQ